jgi:alkylation response protein AidB-like acyl-CoA dehydrogenase
MRSDPLTDEQREIRDLVRTLARERIAPRAAEIDESAEFPWDMVELMREHQSFHLSRSGSLGPMSRRTATCLALPAGSGSPPTR